MAPRMKWILTVVALSAALALALGRGGVSTSRGEELAARSAVWRANSELGATRRSITQWQTLDSVRAVVPDSGVAFVWNADADSGGVFAEARDSILAELAGMNGSRSRIAVLLRRSNRASASFQASLPVQYFAGRDSIGGWCAVVIDVSADHAAAMREAVLAGGSALGPCRFWARYGAPGPAIAGALPQFGAFLGAGRPSAAPDVPRRRGLLGVRQWSAAVAPHLAAQACAADRLDACERALDPAAWRDPFVGSARGADDPAMVVRARWERVLPPPSTFVADLERAIGPEAFARFWRAEGDVADALEAATRVPASRWMRDWTVARFGPEPRGPRMSAATLLLTLAAIAALAAASLLVAARRRVA